MTDKPAKKEPDEDCNARRFDGDRFLGYCKYTSGWGTDKSHGRCKLHGGKGGAPKGEANGNYKHGLYAEIGVTEEERELMERIESDLEDVEMFDLLLEREMARYMRAAGIVGDPEMVAETKMDPQGHIHKVGEHFEIKDGPLSNRAALISSILDNKSKAEHRVAKIDDGVKQRVESSLDDGSQAAIVDIVDSLSGDSDE